MDSIQDQTKLGIEWGMRLDSVKAGCLPRAIADAYSAEQWRYRPLPDASSVLSYTCFTSR